MGVNLHELEDYIHNIEPVTFPHQIPYFPVSKNNVLQFPQPGIKDAEERKEYIPDYMPPIVSSQEEEEEEQVPTDGGTSAEAMQVPLEEEEELEEDMSVNDENFFGKRPLASPETLDMPAMKRPRITTCKADLLDGTLEPREPLSLINSQKVPPMLSPVHMQDTTDLIPATPEPPMLPPVLKSQNLTSKNTESKSGSKSKSKSSSPGHKAKSPKTPQLTAVLGSPIRSPKALIKEKKSPGRAKSPRSPKSPKIPAHILQSAIKTEPPVKSPLATINEKSGKENIQVKLGQTPPEQEMLSLENQSKGSEEADKTIDDSIDAVIARACADREPDPFEFSSGPESEGEVFTSPRRLTISEPTTPKLSASTSSLHKGESTPLPQSGGTSSSDTSWTMEDSINEVIRRANLGTPPVGNPSVGTPPLGNPLMGNLMGNLIGTAPMGNPPMSTPPKGTPPNVPGSLQCFSSPSASPPTPEPLLKVYEEKNKMTPSVDIKKKLKKDLKTKLRKREREKQKDKERNKEKNKDREKNRDKDKDKDVNKDMKLMWKDLSKEDDLESYRFKMKDFEESDPKVRQKDGSGRRERDRHKDKKKDKEKGKKDKEKKEKSKDKGKDEKLKSPSTPIMLTSKDMPLPMFSTPTGVRLPSLLPTLSPLFPEKLLFEEKEKPKEKEKKKDKKEKKKKKEKEKAKEKEKDKKEREKKDKEKEKHKHEKIKVEPVVPAPSPVIPRLTLRVGAGQDKIVISKVVSATEAKSTTTVSLAKTPPLPPSPAPAPAPVHATPPLPTPLPAVVALPPPTPLPTPPTPPPILPPVLPASPAQPSAGSTRIPVRSVVTETVSTYVIRDESGNQIWICPGCNKVDDGSPMIGCDDCDDWYHWPCVGIKDPPPEEAQWFCPKCAVKKKDKKHKKRKHRAH